MTVDVQLPEVAIERLRKARQELWAMLVDANHPSAPYGTGLVAQAQLNGFDYCLQAFGVLEVVKEEQ